MPVLPLSSFSVLKTCMIGNAYAAYKGGIILDNRAKGIETETDEKKLNVLTSIIDSIKVYGMIYTNPSYSFGITSLVYNSTISITIGTTTLDTFTFKTSTASIASQQLIDFINKINQGFRASLTGTSSNPIKISANNGSLSNGLAITIVTTGTITLSLPLQVMTSNGDDFFNRYPARCLPDNQVQGILNKIDSYIDVPFDKFVSF